MINQNYEDLCLKPLYQSRKGNEVNIDKSIFVPCSQCHHVQDVALPCTFLEA